MQMWHKKKNSHNFFVPLTGAKHFTFFPPSAHLSLRLHSHLHPGARQSSLLTTVPFTHILRAHMPSASASIATPPPPPATAVTAVVRPGEALFIPALWFHHVQTQDDSSWAVNVWSDAEVCPLSLHSTSLTIETEGLTCALMCCDVLFDVMSCHVMSCHVMSCDVM
jgi:hypothetical protein